MNLSECFDAIERIASNSSRTEKERLLTIYLDDSTFQKVMLYACDPFRTFGITPPPERTVTRSSTVNEHRFFLVLDLLSSRQLTGTRAREAMNEVLDGSPAAQANLFCRILLKDLRAGFTANTVNRVMPGLIPSFGCMLAHAYDPKRVKRFPVIVEPKLDGFRALIRVQSGKVDIFSRTGKQDFCALPEIEAAFSNMRNCWLDGELKVGSFKNTSSVLRKKSAIVTDAIFNVFDQLTPEEFMNGGSTFSYQMRREGLSTALLETEHVKLVPACTAETHADIDDLYDKFRAQGYEGAIVKDPTAGYDPKRSWAWLKMKAEETYDLPVIGAFEGEGKYAGMLGGLIVDFGGKEVRVGGGFTDQERRAIWSDDHPIGKLIEVEAHEVTEDGSLRHPRFVRFRTDKEAA